MQKKAFTMMQGTLRVNVVSNDVILPHVVYHGDFLCIKFFKQKTSLSQNVTWTDWIMHLIRHKSDKLGPWYLLWVLRPIFFPVNSLEGSIQGKLPKQLFNNFYFWGITISPSFHYAMSAYRSFSLSYDSEKQIKDHLVDDVKKIQSSRR